MKLVYIAAPYRSKTIAGIQLNIEAAKTMAQFQWLAGNAAICPHLNSKNFDGMTDDSVFLDAYLKLMTRCDEVIFHPDYETSAGCRKELALCKKAMIPYTILSKKSLTLMSKRVMKTIFGRSIR